MLKCMSVEDLSNFFSVSCKIIYRWFTINNSFINDSHPPVCIEGLCFYRPLKSSYSRHHCLFHVIAVARSKIFSCSRNYVFFQSDRSLFITIQLNKCYMADYIVTFRVSG